MCSGSRLCFFFSSRRRHTRCSRDWSSDVCSSDLIAIAQLRPPILQQPPAAGAIAIGPEQDRSPQALRRGEPPVLREDLSVPHGQEGAIPRGRWRCRVPRDRKSTRLNSSHGYISYAVFCLKKKKKI